MAKLTAKYCHSINYITFVEKYLRNFTTFKILYSFVILVIDNSSSTTQLLIILSNSKDIVVPIVSLGTVASINMTSLNHFS